MPVEFGMWRIDTGVTPVAFGKMDFEDRLEDILEKDISIASPNWMVIPRGLKKGIRKILTGMSVPLDLPANRRPEVRAKVDEALNFNTANVRSSWLLCSLLGPRSFL